MVLLRLVNTSSTQFNLGWLMVSECDWQVIRAKQDEQEAKYMQERLTGELSNVSAELEDAREELRVVRLQHDQAIAELEKQLLMRPETHGAVAADTTEISQVCGVQLNIVI